MKPFEIFSLGTEFSLSSTWFPFAISIPISHHIRPLFESIRSKLFSQSTNFSGYKRENFVIDTRHQKWKRESKERKRAHILRTCVAGTHSGKA